MSQKVTLREVREGAKKSLDECLKMEFCMVHHCCTGKTDFIQGVKALLIDKQGQAKWDPASIDQVPTSPPSMVLSDAEWPQFTISGVPLACMLLAHIWRIKGS